MKTPSRLLVLGAAIVSALILVAICAPLVAPFGARDIDPNAIFSAPSPAHWAGTDALGRDVFSRIVFGARVSLLVAFGIVAIALVLGAVVGASAALAGGWVDALVMRLVEITMALPGLVIALALTASLGPSLLNLTLALGILGAPFYARIVRGEVRSLRERTHVKAARAIGAGFWRILATHILPNLAPMLATFATMGLSGAVLSASALSFIGLGAQPPTAEWGVLIFEGGQSLLTEWWVALFPGLAVLTAALGFNLLGDGLRDWFDPREAG